jgi:hypothetical protein
LFAGCHDFGLGLNPDFLEVSIFSREGTGRADSYGIKVRTFTFKDIAEISFLFFDPDSGITHTRGFKLGAAKRTFYFVVPKRFGHDGSSAEIDFRELFIT